MKVLKKVINILDIFLEHEGELSLVELSKLSGLNHSNVYRIVSNLAEAGYLKQKHKRGKYSIGFKFLAFSDIIKKDFRIGDLAYPVLKSLNKLTDEAACIVVLNGYEVFEIERVRPSHPLQVVFFEGNKAPLYCTGAGKIFLAYMSDEDLERYLSDVDLVYRTPNTITDRVELKKQLLSSRQEGIAYDDEEHAEGVRGTSAPIKDSSGKVIAAIGIAAPTIRLSLQRMIEIAPIVKSHALEISRMIGHKGD